MTKGLAVGTALSDTGLVPLEARVLLGHVLGRPGSWLVAHAEATLSEVQASAFRDLVRRRRAGEPVAYLVGRREFWGLPLDVSPAVLIPRPETETLVEFVLERLPSGVAAAVLDLGTGSGAIALAVARERPQARVLATDVSGEALAVARRNAERLGLANVEFRQSDWYAAVPTTWRGRPFDIIASNPPYVAADDPHLTVGDLRYEPTAALSPGGDGLGALRTIIAGARSRLVSDGTLAVEHGFDQRDRVAALLDEAGFSDRVTLADLAGHPRVAAARWQRHSPR